MNKTVNVLNIGADKNRLASTRQLRCTSASVKMAVLGGLTLAIIVAGCCTACKKHGTARTIARANSPQGGTGEASAGTSPPESHDAVAILQQWKDRTVRPEDVKWLNDQIISGTLQPELVEEYFAEYYGDVGAICPGTVERDSEFEIRLTQERDPFVTGWLQTYFVLELSYDDELELVDPVRYASGKPMLMAQPPESHRFRFRAAREGDATVTFTLHRIGADASRFLDMRNPLLEDPQLSYWRDTVVLRRMIHIE